MKSVNDNIPYFERKSQVFALLHELGVDEISQFRTDLKRDSMKCWILLSSVNFPWTRIHWFISNIQLMTQISSVTNYSYKYMSFYQDLHFSNAYRIVSTNWLLDLRQKKIWLHFTKTLWVSIDFVVKVSNNKSQILPGFM